MTDTQTSPDDQRDPALKAAVDDCLDFITRRFVVFRALTGIKAQFLLTAVADDRFEAVGAVIDPDTMIEGFASVVAQWMEQGILTAEPGDDDPLFTATFDPAKARLS